MGSMHTQKMQERGRHYAATASDGGATVETLGVLDDESTFDEGFFLRPALVANIASDAPLVLEEQFSPVIPVLRFSNVEEALRQAKAAIRNNLIHSFFASRKDGVVPLAMKRVTNDI
jgi:acyl-CoA reductase-like NAD-dependent aldehyde dehydrogenase